MELLPPLGGGGVGDDPFWPGWLLDGHLDLSTRKSDWFLLLYLHASQVAFKLLWAIKAPYIFVCREKNVLILIDLEA